MFFEICKAHCETTAVDFQIFKTRRKFWESVKKKVFVLNLKLFEKNKKTIDLNDKI